MAIACGRHVVVLSFVVDSMSRVNYNNQHHRAWWQVMEPLMLRLRMLKGVISRHLQSQNIFHRKDGFAYKLLQQEQQRTCEGSSGGQQQASTG
jgi:hypothetical protein